MTVLVGQWQISLTLETVRANMLPGEIGKNSKASPITVVNAFSTFFSAYPEDRSTLDFAFWEMTLLCQHSGLVFFKIKHLKRHHNLLAVMEDEV